MSRVLLKIQTCVHYHFFDNAKVNLLSNVFRLSAVPKGENLSRGILEYRNRLGKTDHFDRQFYLYYWNHRNIKWHQALLKGLLKMAINNGWIIYNELHGNISLRQFILKMINYLAPTEKKTTT